MSEITDLINIKMSVLKSLEDVIPETVITAFENDYLCYWMKIDNQKYPVIDFERQMPYDMREYKQLIQESAQEWLYRRW